MILFVLSISIIMSVFSKVLIVIILVSVVLFLSIVIFLILGIVLVKLSAISLSYNFICLFTKSNIK